MNNPFGLLNLLPQIKANPMQFIMQRRMNVPQGVSMSNPNEILNYLVSTGQVSQQQINNAYQMAKNLQSIK